MNYSRPLYYILKGKEVVPVESVFEMAEFLEKDDSRRIRRTEIKGVTISTVFLGIDHNFTSDKSSLPIVFETMIFGGVHDGYQERDAVYDSAIRSHEKACMLVQRTPFIQKWYYYLKYQKKNCYWFFRYLGDKLFRE